MSGKIFVLGSYVVDCAYRAARLPVPGETLLGTSFALGPGGKGSNQAVAAARAGAQVSFLTAIGKDAFGEIGSTLWAAEGIDASLVKRTDVATGSAAILLHQESGANAIIVVPGACATLTRQDVDNVSDSIGNADLFMAQLELPLEVVTRGLEIARGAGVTTILNPAPAPLEPLPQSLLQLVDYLIPNETEAAALTQLPTRTMDEAKHAAGVLLAQGAGNVVVTMGECGSVLALHGRTIEVVEAVCPGVVVDTTGAGDAFCGAFAAALAEARLAAQAARFASAAAGISVTRHGTAPSMPYRQQIEDLLDRSAVTS